MRPAIGPWWKDYRQKQYKPRQIMTMEMIIRLSFVKVLREYTDNCSISGVKQMCDPKLWWPQRMIRVCLFCFMFSLVSYYLYNTWCEALARPLIVNSETTTYPISKIDFPAVALCNVNRISKKALKAFAMEMHPELALNNETIEKIEKFWLQAGRLLDFSYDDNKLEGNVFLDMDQRRHDTRFIVDAMKTLAPSCSEMLERCSWGGNIINCTSAFEVRRTAHGHCCAFNYVLEYHSASSPIHSKAEAERQLLPGYSHGLNIVLNPMLDDYAFPLNPFMGFDVLLFDPTHFADLSAGRLVHRLVEPNQAEFMELKSIRQVASPEVRKYPLTVRKCFFRDEQNEMFNGMYSYSGCIVRCRIKSIQSLCKCTPYFLPAGLNEGPICFMEDLMCLNKYKEKLLYLYPIDAEKTDGLEVELEDSLFCPECLPDCELTRYSSKSYKIPIKRLAKKAYYVDEFLEDINMTNKCFLSIHHPVSDAVLERLDVIAYWFEILSNIGGFGGVVIGFSVCAVVEIVYFLLVRFMILIRYNYLKYH